MDAIQSLLEDGYVIDSHVAEGWWRDTGKSEDILEVNRLVLKDRSPKKRGIASDNVTVDGRIELTGLATIEDGAVVHGPVSIVDGMVIKSGAYAGLYTSVGPNSILEGVHIENSVAVGESNISTSGRIVGGSFGRGANIGSADGFLPEDCRLVIGENSQLKL